MRALDYQELAYECEALLKSQKSPQAEGAPIGAIRVYDENSTEGVPTAIVNHPAYGYVVIASAGQGPMVCWMERNDKC